MFILALLLALIIGISLAFFITVCRVVKSNEMGNSSADFEHLSNGIKITDRRDRLSQNDAISAIRMNMLKDNIILASKQNKKQ